MDEKNLGGRPRKELDLKLFQSLCEIHCTALEICDILEMCEDTLDARLKEIYGYGFSEYTRKNNAKGKKRLRRAQFQAAVEKHNPTMLIWLGKQILGQTDKIETANDDKVRLVIEGMDDE